MPRGGCRRHRHEDDIRTLHQCVHVHPLDIPFLQECISDKRIVAHHISTERSAPLRNLPADLSEGDNTDALSPQVTVDKTRVIAELVRHREFIGAPDGVLPVPETFTCGEFFMPLRGAAQGREREPEGAFRHRLRPGARRFNNGNAARLEGFKRDTVSGVVCHRAEHFEVRCSRNARLRDSTAVEVHNADSIVELHLFMERCAVLGVQHKRYAEGFEAFHHLFMEKGP